MAHLKLEMVKNGVFGHAIGDALGVPVEFRSREHLTANPVTDMIGFGTHNMPAGTWSDDTSMEIALMQSLIDRGSFDYADIMKNFSDWLHFNMFNANGITFDVGGTCSAAISKFRPGVDPLSCGEKHEYSNGNGSLMRILPVAFVAFANDLNAKQRYELTKNVSSLTHAHEISVLGCYIYVNYVCHLLSGKSKTEAYAAIQNDDYSMVPQNALPAYERILTMNIAELSRDEISSSGYVVASLEASLWCLLNSDSYEDAVLTAVNLGSDTDTVGAITGSMAGLCYAIPEKWEKQLLRHDYLKELCETFAATNITV
jgi:ADP-ribosylglycohydrolase